jgi:tetratricopeptide (TPR) repeat protein
MKTAQRDTQSVAPYALDLQENLTVGRRMLRLFDLPGYEEAVIHFRHALEHEPAHIAALSGLAEAYSYWGFRRELNGEECQSYYDLSLEQARAALRADPHISDSHRALSVALRRGARSDPNRARAEILIAVDLRDDDADTWYQYWRAFGYDVSDPSIHRALKLDPQLCGAHNDLGAALCGRDRLDEAVLHFRAALRINPRNSLTHYNLAMTLDRQGQAEKAVAVLRMAREMRPKDPLLESGWKLLGGGMS